MKGQACSWRDMRKIRHILQNMERLKGEYEALIRCSTKQAREQWRRSLDVLEAMGGQVNLTKTTPTHAVHIARLAPRDAWPSWVQRCETEQLTVAELRGALLADQAKQAAADAAASAPSGKYRTIVADPPWDYGNKSGRHAGSSEEYLKKGRTMDLDTVAAFDVQRWVPDDGPCHLYLWVTDAYAGDIYQVVRKWGFEPKAWLIWVKDRIGMGNYFRHQHEPCVFAVRGRLRLKRMDASTVFNAPVGAHSEKPDAFYSLVESCSPGPYLDVFARRKRAGWDVFGDDVAADYQMRLDGNNGSTLVGCNGGK